MNSVKLEVPQPSHDAGVAGLRLLALCEFPPFLSCGGSDHVVWQVHRRLAAQGAEVTILACSPADHPPLDEVHDGIRIKTVTSTDVGRLVHAEATLAPRLFPAVFELWQQSRPHVIHANSLHFQSSVAGALLRRVHRTPLVTTAHIGSLRHLKPALRLGVGVYEQTVGRAILHSSQQVIAVSPSVARHVLALGVPERKITTIANGVDHGRFHVRGTTTVRHVPRVVFVGRLMPNKGPDLLLAALVELFRRQVELEAVFIGDGPMREQLEGAVREHRLGDRVRFTGRVVDVERHLADADVMVRPSMTEGMPLAVLEAMASGVCVVASDAEGNTDLVRHGHNGLLFPVGDADALARQLARVVVDRDLRTTLAAAGRRTAEGHSWDACSMATGAVLAAAAGVGRR